MPEGDAIHRAARRLQVLVGQELDVETPHPRAAVKQLAPKLDGRRLESVEAIGKNLLFRFEGRPDFSEREKAMLALARPHMAELHTRRDRELRGVPNLTPRQWEVLRLVAKGAGNRQIARTLGISDATVRRHLENAFFRLGVQCRTEAVARVRAFLDAA